MLPLIEVSVDEILDAQRREQESKQESDKLLTKALKERGLRLIPDLSQDDMFWSINQSTDGTTKAYWLK